jgi:glutamine amidotransferase
MRKIKLGILDYGMGNLTSLENSLNFLNAKPTIIHTPDNLERYSHIILPGVGSFKVAINNLKKIKLIEKIKKIVKIKKSKILGICLGMQLLGIDSYENGHTKGLGLIKLRVKKFRFKNINSGLKIPHVGFNQIKIVTNKKKFFDNIKDNADFYFIHSYKLDANPKINYDYATCKYGKNFLAAFNHENIFGTQFHPEKSQSNGLTLLYNFLKN